MKWILTESALAAKLKYHDYEFEEEMELKTCRFYRGKQPGR